jgi:hypothetical protein
MPSRWSEAYEDVTPAPSDEEREQGRERLRALSGFTAGYGRCKGCNTKPHPERGCLCGRSVRHG